MFVTAARGVGGVCSSSKLLMGIEDVNKKMYVFEQDITIFA